MHRDKQLRALHALILLVAFTGTSRASQPATPTKVAPRFANPVPPELTTSSDLTAEVDGVPVWVENLTKACPEDAPAWFRANATKNLAVNIAAFTCTKPSRLTLHLQQPLQTLFELNVTDGAFYSQAPPGRIQGVRLKNIQWEKACPIVITGYNADHLVEDVVFENCQVAGAPLTSAQIQTNAFTKRIVVR